MKKTFPRSCWRSLATPPSSSATSARNPKLPSDEILDLLYDRKMRPGALPSLRPLASAPRRDLAAIHTVLTDIDDTLTVDGRLPARAYEALEHLSVANLCVVAVTGRPAGWCDLIARFWPVAGVIGENGALAYRYDRAARRMVRVYAKDPTARAGDRLRLNTLADEILASVPGTALAADQAFRLADLAIDYREDVPHLDFDIAAEIVRHFEAAGARAKISSIHVNGWFGDYDKLSMTTRFLHHVLGTNLAEQQDRVVYVGDSPNDEPFFAALPLTVGVANLRPFVSQMSALPTYITSEPGGAGFAEFAQALLASR